MDELSQTKSASRQLNSQCIQEGISIVIPCYEEAVEAVQSTVEATVEALAQLDGINYEIVLVDDGSKTVDYTKFEKREKSVLVRHKVNRGYGASLATGIRNAKYPWIGIIDADGTYPCERFPDLIRQLGDFEMVIGARRWREISPLRRPAKIALTLFASYLSNYKIPDLNSGMRVFHRRIYEENWRIYPERFSFSSTLTMAALTHLHDVKFVTIEYRKRIGNSFISPVQDTIRFFYQLLRLSLYFRPLRVFMPMSGCLLVMALARGTRDYLVTEALGGVTLILFFMAFQVFFFGLIAETINKK
jgi:glycosyltransferase involved in cell wall biosynthesis